MKNNMKFDELKSLTQQIEYVKHNVKEKLKELVDKFGSESEHKNTTVLKVKGENNQVNIEGSRYLTEIDIDNEVLIDNLGYESNFESICFLDLCSIVDNQESRYESKIEIH